MSTRLVGLSFEANEPLRVALFWAAALDWEIDETVEEIRVAPEDGSCFPFSFRAVDEPKAGKNRIHLDLVSESPERQAEMVGRLLSLGACHIDVGQGPEADHVVLADPEGNEFCVVIRSDFLATTDLMSSVVFEPAGPAVGRFWSQATGWPTVYEQHGDSAIRAPDGRGPFVTFGPPSDEVKSWRNRLQLDIAPLADGDQAAETQRLIDLGAAKIDGAGGADPWIAMVDPEGNEFRLHPPQ